MDITMTITDVTMLFELLGLINKINLAMTLSSLTQESVSSLKEHQPPWFKKKDQIVDINSGKVG